MSHDREQIDEFRKDRQPLEAALIQAGAKVVGGRVNCPFHPDTHPSGSLFRGKSGDWLYRCRGCGWNAGKPGDVFAVIMHRDGINFARACETLGLGNASRNGNGHLKHTGRKPPRRTEAPPPTDLAESAGESRVDCASLAAESHQRLLNDSQVVELLQNTRGVDRPTAERLRIGITADGKYWTFPIANGSSNLVAVKHHRVDSNGRDTKNFWVPKGTNSDHVYPVYLDPPGPVWLCPGELKAAAVVACGLPAVGITCGEGCDLPARALEACRGRPVAVPPDDDAAGQSWEGRVRRQLTDAGIEHRLVRLPLDGTAGRKDIADYIVALQSEGKEPEAIAATLLHYWERADPWFGTSLSQLMADVRVWRPITVVPTGLESLDSLLGGGFRTSGVHLLCGKPGQGKSQLAVSIALGAARLGIPTAYFSLELSSIEVTQLVAAQLAGIPRLRLAYGKLDAEQGRALKAAASVAASMRLWILDDDRWPAGLTRDTLAMLVADGVERFGWQMVVVDYLGLLVPLESDRDTYHIDLLNSTILKKLARKHDLSLLVVSAVRKGTTKRDAATIALDDLLGAGRLAYDAQTVLLCSREYGDSDCGIIRVRPLKMRFASCDEKAEDLQLRWRPRTGLITDLSSGDSEA